MASETVPVVVHRWFADGEGWAHDPSLTADDVLEIMQLFDRELKGTGEDEFADAALGGWLIGERRLDHETQDRLAKHRSPTVFRVALLKRKPSDEEEAALRQRLSQVLPDLRGTQPLRIELPDLPPPPATPPDRGQRWLIVVSASVLVLLLVAVGLKWVVNPAGRRPDAGENPGNMSTSAPSDGNVGPSTRGSQKVRMTPVPTTTIAPASGPAADEAPPGNCLDRSAQTSPPTSLRAIQPFP